MSWMKLHKTDFIDYMSAQNLNLISYHQEGKRDTGECPGQTDSLHMDRSMWAGQQWQGRGASGMSQRDRAVTPSSAAWRKFWHLHPSFRPYKYHRTIRFNQKHCWYISHDTSVKNWSAVKQYFCDFSVIAHIASEQTMLFRSTAVHNLINLR